MTLEILPAKPQALFFQAMSNSARMQILNLLRENGRMSVTQICSGLGMEQTHVSHNLRCLAFCGLVTASREGKSRIYSINGETILPLLKIVDEHLRKYAVNLLTCDALER
ncbi:MAG: helix-turn-helix transcriptional regulator [Nitrososphaerota archaeon]|nr:helix-turn-helix transcriptional regulator [Nitrososphaerota archaeon]